MSLDPFLDSVPASQLARALERRIRRAEEADVILTALKQGFVVTTQIQNIPEHDDRLKRIRIAFLYLANMKNNHSTEEMEINDFAKALVEECKNYRITISESTACKDINCGAQGKQIKHGKEITGEFVERIDNRPVTYFIQTSKNRKSYYRCNPNFCDFDTLSRLKSWAYVEFGSPIEVIAK